MNVIIVGCGRVGAELALLLSRRGHDVTVIDHVGSSFGHLDPAYRGRTIEAEPLAEGVLEKAGIRRRAGARHGHELGRGQRGRGPRRAHGLRRAERGGPQLRPALAGRSTRRWACTSVSSTAWGAQRIEELLERPRLRAVFSAGNGEVELYELPVPEALGGADARRARRRDRLLAGVAHPRRAGEPARSRSGSLAAGDIVHVTATLEGAGQLGRRLEAEEA